MSADKKTVERIKRNQERMLKVSSGASELEAWLKDLLRAGLLQLPQQNAEWFDKMRAKMTDAQAPGLGNLVRALKELPYRDDDKWQSESIHIISRMFLLIEGIRRLDSLDANTQNDIRHLIGWPVNQKEVLEDTNSDNTSDNWLAVGRFIEMVDDITVQRNYLYGLQSGKVALQINFAFRTAPIATHLLPGGVYELDLTFVPSALPQRAIIRKSGEEKKYQPENIAMLPDFNTLLTQMARFRALYPWVEDYPFAVGDLSPLKYQNGFFIKDREGKLLEISAEFSVLRCLNLLACTGGRPHYLFVLFSKGKIIPLGIIGKKRYVLL